MMGEFFGLTRRKFTDADMLTLAKSVAKALADAAEPKETE